MWVLYFFIIYVEVYFLKHRIYINIYIFFYLFVFMNAAHCSLHFRKYTCSALREVVRPTGVTVPSALVELARFY